MECDRCKQLEQNYFALEERLQTLERFIHINLGSDYVEIRNLKVITDGHNQAAILALGSGGASGWQVPIKVDGTTKCMICEELSESSLVCRECQMAVMSMRAEGQIEGLTSFAEAVSQGLIERWIEEQLEGMEGEPGDE